VYCPATATFAKVDTGQNLIYKACVSFASLASVKCPFLHLHQDSREGEGLNLGTIISVFDWPVSDRIDISFRHGVWRLLPASRIPQRTRTSFGSPGGNPQGDWMGSFCCVTMTVIVVQDELCQRAVHPLILYSREHWQLPSPNPLFPVHVLGDVSASRNCSESVLLQMKRNRGQGSAWGEKLCGRGNREGSSHPEIGTHAGAQIARDRNP
jgi:hypothetical protein